MSTYLQRRRGGILGDDVSEAEINGWNVEEGLANSVFKRRRRQRRVNLDFRKVKAVAVFAVAWIVLFFYSTDVLRIGHLRIPVPNVDVRVPDAKEWPLIHIVHSRFMQEQGPLETLGMARLKLFLTFCLPSMVQQTSQNFFWIIKTDPKFESTAVFEELIQSVLPYENIYVVGSNENFVFGSAGREGSWRDGKAILNLLDSKIHSGNMTKLKIAMALHNERPVLETRLDADDGLHRNYIEYIQGVALKRFQPSESKGSKDRVPQWLYWCSRRHIEWHSASDVALTDDPMESLGSDELGYLNMVQHDKLCVTPGITIGYNINIDGTSDSDVVVPQYDHDKLYKKVRNSMACYASKHGDPKDEERTSPCLELVEDFSFCAIRSRTWTSAGMYGVNLDPKDVPFRGKPEKQKQLTKRLWTEANESFGVTQASAIETQRYLLENKKEIARENLLGQCSSGHSCKDSAKEKLAKIAQEGVERA